MSKRTKGEKRKRRASAVKAKQQRERDRAQRRERYPQFIFRENRAIEVPNSFLSALQKAARSVRFDDRAIFSREGEAVLRYVKEHGIRAAIRHFCGDLERHQELIVAVDLEFMLGEVLFSRVPPSILAENIPYLEVAVRLRGTDIDVRFDGLLRDRTPQGTVYFSSSKPTVNIDGEEKTVAFSRHAIEQLRERRVGRWDTYQGACEAFTYLATWRRFDLVQAPGDQREGMLLSVYDSCAPGFLAYRHVEHLLDDPDPEAKYWYRMGYLPLGVTDKYASALTLLTPGMRGTPERDLLDRAHLPRDERRRIEAGIENAVTCDRLFSTDDFSALKWFHDSGVPQVMTLDESPFDEGHFSSAIEADVEAAARLLGELASGSREV